MFAHVYKNFLLVVVLGSVFHSVISQANSASDQLDEQDLQEFNIRIDRANACAKSHNFTCAAQQLSQAKNYVNGVRDQNTLQKTMDSVELQRQLAIRDDAKHKYASERLAVATNAENSENELAESHRNNAAEMARTERQRQRADVVREKPQSNSEYYASLGAELQQRYAEDAALLNKMHSQTNAAYAETNRRLAAQATERDRARAERDEREADRRRDADRSRANAQRTAQAQGQNEANARNKRDADALRAQQEREQKRVDNERRDQEVRDNSERKRVAEAAAAKQKSETAAAKLAEQQAEKQAREQYLKRVASGTRLVATKCPDGEGKYYATGSRPSIKPEVVGCVDVHFRAYCSGSTQYSNVVAHNFIGMSGCFGDTYDINPKPACKVDQVRIEVVEARACGG